MNKLIPQLYTIKNDAKTNLKDSFIKTILNVLCENKDSIFDDLMTLTKITFKKEASFNECIEWNIK